MYSGLQIPHLNAKQICKVGARKSELIIWLSSQAKSYKVEGIPSAQILHEIADIFYRITDLFCADGSGLHMFGERCTVGWVYYYLPEILKSWTKISFL